MIETSLFPYENFPVRLHQKDENKVCWFKDEIDLQKYLNRYKLDKKTIKIDYRDGESIQPSKRNKRSVEQTPKPKSNRGTGAVRKGKSSVDPTGNTTRNPKRKK
jgi:hypothetical protein